MTERSATPAASAAAPTRASSGPMPGAPSATVNAMTWIPSFTCASPTLGDARHRGQARPTVRVRARSQSTPPSDKRMLAGHTRPSGHAGSCTNGVRPSGVPARGEAERVAHAAHRVDQRRAVDVDLLAQVADVGLQHAGVAGEVVVP